MNPRIGRIVNGAACASALAVALAITGAAGCGSQEKEDRDFHTSGNREADQRAAQRVAKTQQLRGEGSGEGDEKKGNVKASLFDGSAARRGSP
jgi:ABC-type phosphate transport system substrate-binding protein